LWDPVNCKAVITDFDTSCLSRSSGYYRRVGRENYDAPEKIAIAEKRNDEFESALCSYNRKFNRQSFKRKRRSTRLSIVRPYRDNADVYSAGIIFWMLLKGKKDSPKRRTVEKWIRNAKKKGLHRDYPEINLLLKMLNPDPRYRITLEHALEHDFLNFEPEMENDIIYMGVQTILGNFEELLDNMSDVEYEESDNDCEIAINDEIKESNSDCEITINDEIEEAYSDCEITINDEIKEPNRDCEIIEEKEKTSNKKKYETFIIDKTDKQEANLIIIEDKEKTKNTKKYETFIVDKNDKRANLFFKYKNDKQKNHLTDLVIENTNDKDKPTLDHLINNQNL
jgi:serine/threonine protein kinase